MDGKLAEKLDSQRYWAVLLQTTGLLLVFAETLWMYIDMGAAPGAFIIGGSFFGTMPATVSPGLFMLVTGGIWYGVVYLKTRRDPQVFKALYNEMYQEHKHRYQRMSLWVIIGISILGIIVLAPRYPHVIVTEMIVLTGLLTMKISWLMYNRR